MDAVKFIEGLRRMIVSESNRTTMYQMKEEK